MGFYAIFKESKESVENFPNDIKKMLVSENIYDKAAEEIFALYQVEKQKLAKLQEERNELLNYLNKHRLCFDVVFVFDNYHSKTLSELESKIYEQNLVLIGIGKSYKRLCNKADMEN